MSVITDAEAWDMVRRLDAKAEALLKPPAARLGIDSPAMGGELIRYVWHAFCVRPYGRSAYPYSVLLQGLTHEVNRHFMVCLEPWHVYGLIVRAHKWKPNWGKHRGKSCSLGNHICSVHEISLEQLKAMGSVSWRIGHDYGDDVAMTSIMENAANVLARDWGPWVTPKIAYVALELFRKSRKLRRVQA
jgi:hypothetical protein